MTADWLFIYICFVKFHWIVHSNEIWNEEWKKHLLWYHRLKKSNPVRKNQTANVLFNVYHTHTRLTLGYNEQIERIIATLTMFIVFKRPNHNEYKMEMCLSLMRFCYKIEFIWCNLNWVNFDTVNKCLVVK